MRKIVAITALGALAYANKAAAPEPKVGIVAIEGFTPPPKPTRGPNASKYPFDALEVGQSFAVSGKDRRQMASPVNNANKKYRTEFKDDAGKVVRTEQEREFYAVDVDAETAKKLKGTENEGAKVLIVRSK